MTVREFLTALDSGLHEKNLKSLIAGVTPLINLPSTERERAAFYLIQAVLTDTLDSWVGKRPLATSWLQQIEASLFGGVQSAPVLRVSQPFDCAVCTVCPDNARASPFGVP